MLDQTISRIRRNHGLEHATIHVLTEKYKQFSAQGNSDHRGFSLNIYGDIKDYQVDAAVQEAYERLRNGEHQLAVHPNCGTVLVTTATLSTLAVQLVFGVDSLRNNSSSKNKLNTLLNTGPMAVLMATLAIIVSKPLGMKLQEKYTTDGHVGNLKIVQVRKVSPSIVTRLFQILLVGGQDKYQPTAYRIETEG
ncbi:MAG: DUF6391 domain-containing protein [Candidatus Promineifilaceae bacterium]|jgi:hypothetical protein